MGHIARYSMTRPCLQSDAPVSTILPPRSQGLSLASEWPLRTFLELGAFPSAVPCARLHARQVLWEWKLTHFGESVELLVSELLTNAVNASRALEPITPVRFWMLSDEASVLVIVWDGNSQPPVCVEADELDDHGRGLLLVEALSHQWNWYVPPELGGKVVSALVNEDSHL